MTRTGMVLGIALVLTTIAGIARADVTAAWNQNAGGNWSAGANWAGGTAATGTTGVAYFTNAITATRYVTNDVSPWTINSMVFSNNGANYLRIATNGTINLGGTTPTIAVNGSASKVSVGAALTGSSGLVKTGAGELDIDPSLNDYAAGFNTYSGGTYIRGGTLMFGTDGKNYITNLLGSGIVYLGDTNGSADATLRSPVGSYTLTNNIVLLSGNTGTMQINNAFYTLTLSGAITLGEANDKGKSLTLGGSTLNITGIIQDPAGMTPGTAGKVTLANTDIVTFNGATANTYSGATVVNSGATLRTAANNAINAGLPPTTALTLNGTLDMWTRSFTIGSLSGTGKVDQLYGAATSQTLTIGSNNNSTVFSGSISNKNGFTSLTKIGSGTLTLASANAYAGITTISNGTLAVSNNLALSTNAVILAGGTLGAADGTWAITNVVNVQSASSLGANGTLALMGNVTNNGALTKVGTGGLLFNGVKTGTNWMMVSAGYLGGTGTVAGVVTNAGTITAADTNSIGTLTVTNLVMQNGSTCLVNFGSNSCDRITVTGTLTLPTPPNVATVNVSRISGTWASNPAVLFSAPNISGTVGGLVVRGDARPGAQLIIRNNQVQLVSPTGMMLMLD